jgi:type II secretory pathway pseudopilin PulG
MKNIKKNKPGSILAYSLIIISIMIAIVAATSIATVIGKKSASSTDASVQAYQTADSGVQLATKKINDNLGQTIGSVFSGCSNGTVSNQSYAGLNGTYALSFYSDETGNNPLGCDGQDNLVDNIRNIKSIGVYNGTVRALNVAVTLNKIETNADLMLLLDRSTSMEDSEFQSVKDAAKKLIDEFGNDEKVGIVGFSNAYSSFPLTVMDSASNRNNIKAFIDSLVLDSGTNQGVAIKLATDEIKSRGRTGSPKYIILVTDGAPSDLSDGGSFDNSCPCTGPSGSTGCWDTNTAQNTRTYANTAKSNGITIFALGVGFDQLLSDCCRQRVVDLLQYVATSSSDYYQINDFDKLSKALIGLVQ